MNPSPTATVDFETAKATLSSAMGLNGDDSPFPWQLELLRRFLHGELPDACDIPTGLGKTSVMNIWLVARCFGASIPRRLVYVVDRRAVVDQATDTALHLRQFMEDHPELKERLGLGNASLPISTLRGQFLDNREWLANPAWPAIIVGTVDMIGSRLLFEGYGVSRKMRPFHAGLLVVDTLMVLDEAHLVPPFEHLLHTIATETVLGPRDPHCTGLVPRFRLLSLSATARNSSGTVLTLTREDAEHAVLKRRLNAPKHLILRLTEDNNKSALADLFANETWKLTNNGSKPTRVLVFCDSREVAQKAKDALENLAGPIQTELLVGARRVFERMRARDNLDTLGFLARSPAPRQKPAFLFATSAGEVGVDLDADHMVCDLVAWERMIQRLGRVNRRGSLADHIARIVVLVEPEPRPDRRTQQALDKMRRGEKLSKEDRKKIEQHESAVRDWRSRQQPFRYLPSLNDGSLDVSVAALRHLSDHARICQELQDILTAATSPEPLRPALTLPLVEAWSLTALKDHPGRPEVQPWLRGWVTEEPQTAIVWRTYLPVRNGSAPPTAAEIERFFEAAPPHLSEILEVEHFRAANWLRVRAQKIISGQSKEGVPLDNGLPVAFALNGDGSFRRYFHLRNLAASDADNITLSLAGATLIVDARLGGLKDGLLDERESSPPATADGSEWLDPGTVGFRIRQVDSSEQALREREWRERFRFACEMSPEGEPLQWLVIDKWRDQAATEDDRAEGAPQLLEQHAAHVESKARELAKALQLPADLTEALACAARFHDHGKGAPRWQRAFHAPRDGVYAKTEGPIAQELLDGYRHELGSILRVCDDRHLADLSPDLRDLVLHLIAAHHGYARPVIPISGCDDAPPSVLEKTLAETALRFARLQLRYGPWGLAWLESLVRAADQMASRELTPPLSACGGGK